MKDLYDLFLAVTVYPNVIELGDLLQAKRNYNNQFNLIDMLSASLNKDLFKVSKAKMFEWLWLNSQFDRSWSISDIVYAEHNCKIPEEVFRKSKTTIRTNDLVVYQMMLLHHYIYGQFSTEEFLTLLRLQNHYPETLDLCRILKNIDPTMTMDKIGEILYLDKKYNRSLFQSW